MNATVTATESRAGDNPSIIVVDKDTKEEFSSSSSPRKNSSRRRIVTPLVSGRIKTGQSQQQKQPLRLGHSKKMNVNTIGDAKLAPGQSQCAHNTATSGCSLNSTSTSPSPLQLGSITQAGSITTLPPVDRNQDSTTGSSSTIKTLLVKSDEQISPAQASGDMVEARNAGTPSANMSSYPTENDCRTHQTFNQADVLNKNTNISFTSRGSGNQNHNDQAISRYRPQKYCAVCGDKAIACNFNAVTCESCKAFFRRNAFKEQRLKCLFDNRCVIDKVTRRFCSKCRLLKCFGIGMKREWILTDEQKQIKRVKIMQNKQTKQHQHVSTSGTVMSNTMSPRDIPSVGSNQSRSNDSPNFTQNSRDQPSSDIVEKTQVDIQLVHVGDKKRRLSNQSNDNYYRVQPQTRDASTSCPDESDLMSGNIIHYCSMAYSCQYCSLRLTPGVEQHLHQVSSEHSQHPGYLHQTRQHQYDYHERQQPHHHSHPQLQQQHYYHHQQQQQQDFRINHNYQSNSHASSVQAQTLSSSSCQLSQHPMAADAAHTVHADANYFTVMPTANDQVSGSASAGHQMSTIQSNCQHGQASGVETSQVQSCCCESTSDTTSRHGSNDCTGQRSQSSFDRANYQTYVSQSPQFHMMEPSQIQRKALQSSAQTSFTKNTPGFPCCDTNNNVSQQQQQGPDQRQHQIQHQQANSSASAAHKKRPDLVSMNSNPFVMAVEGQRSSLVVQMPSQTAADVRSSSVVALTNIKPVLKSDGQVEYKWDKNFVEKEHTGEISSAGVEDPTSTSVEEVGPQSPIVAQIAELVPSTDNDQSQQAQQNQNDSVGVTKPSNELSTLSDSILNKANCFFWKGEPYMSPATTQDEMKIRIENMGFSETERHLVQEMLDATRLMFDPSNVDRSFNETSLDDFVYFCDSALRCLIKTVKQINAFRILGMDDQIMLLKTACFKILLLRSCLYYNEEIEGWRDRRGNIMPLSLLKTAKSSVYEKHKDVLSIMACPLRNDRIIMGFMALVLLFDPATTIKHSNSVGLDNLIYLCVLRKYLIGTQPNPLAKYERLVEATRRVNICNEEYNVFFSKNFQPEQITPLLIEIFDISINNSV